MTTPLLLPIKKDLDTIKTTVITTLVKMLIARKWIYESKREETIKQILNEKNENIKINLDIDLKDVEFYFDSNHKPSKDFNGKMIILKIINYVVSGISKLSTVSDTITSFENNHKIFIFENITDKAKNQLLLKPFTEVFNERSLMFNILEFSCSPQYEVLTKKQINEFLTTYLTDKNKIKKICINDPITIYFYLKKGQILRIIRNSELTGTSIDYRIVIPTLMSVK